MKSFELNGETITPRAITFNTICDLEDRGYDISEMGDRTFSFVRVFVELWTGCSKEEAGDKIDAHLANGGSIDVLMEAITEAVNESSFFSKKGKKSPQKKLKIAEPTDSDL